MTGMCMSRRMTSGFDSRTLRSPRSRPRGPGPVASAQERRHDQLPEDRVVLHHEDALADARFGQLSASSNKLHQSDPEPHPDPYVAASSKMPPTRDPLHPGPQALEAIRSGLLLPEQVLAEEFVGIPKPASENSKTTESVSSTIRASMELPSAASEQRSFRIWAHSSWSLVADAKTKLTKLGSSTCSFRSRASTAPLTSSQARWRAALGRRESGRDRRVRVKDSTAALSEHLHGVLHPLVDDPCELRSLLLQPVGARQQVRGQLDGGRSRRSWCRACLRGVPWSRTGAKAKSCRATRRGCA